MQSHVPEFDCLKSCDISPRISALEWWPFGSSHMTLLAANDRSVKVWRTETKPSQVDRQERQQRRASVRMRAQQHREGQGQQPPHEAESVDRAILSLWGRAASLSDQSGDEFPPVSSRCCAVFRGGHQYSIHSVSSCADGATFLSADDLRVLLFDIEHSDTACSVVELSAAAPAVTSAAAVDELLTVARFHPQHTALFLHGSSSGTVRIADMRLRLNCTIDNTTTHSAAVDSQPPCHHHLLMCCVCARCVPSVACVRGRPLCPLVHCCPLFSACCLPGLVSFVRVVRSVHTAPSLLVHSKRH